MQVIMEIEFRRTEINFRFRGNRRKLTEVIFYCERP